MRLPVAVLAGGLATRLYPLTERIPKSLVDVAGRPFAVHQIDLLHQNGVTDIVYLLGQHGAMVRDALGDGSRYGVRLRYVFDGPRALGTGGAIRSALGALGEAFLLLYGDSYLECDYAAVEAAFLGCGKSGLMTVCRNDDRWDRSNVWCESGRIVRYDKRARVPEMRHIDYGLGAFRPAAFAGWAEGEALDLAVVYQALIAADDLAAFEVGSRFYEIGSPAGLEEVRAYLARDGATRE
jgi:NDP-sugar pyrophosphorylase family protein